MIDQSIAILTSLNLKCKLFGTGTMRPYLLGSFYSKEDNSKCITLYLRTQNLRANLKKK